MKVAVSVEQAKEVELATRTQYKSKLWYRFRAGRITASKAKSACNTDPSKPSQSLVKAIGYPDSCTFSTVATDPAGCVTDGDMFLCRMDRVRLVCGEDHI